MYLILKTIHMVFAALTITGFVMRGYWMMSGSKLRQHRVTRIAPHIIDLLFLITGIWLIVELNIAPMQHPWLLAKFAGLFAYIGLGMVAMRFGRTPQIRAIGFAGALLSFVYIVGVALTKSPVL